MRQARESKDAKLEIELATLKEKRVYQEVDRVPPGAMILRTMHIFRVKCDVEKFKIRILVDGSSQTYAPVAFAATIRLVLVVALHRQMHVSQYDIRTAFLYSKLPAERKVYAREPPGFKEKKYWRLLGSLYGLRDAPKLFNAHLHKTLTATRSTTRACIY